MTIENEINGREHETTSSSDGGGGDTAGWKRRTQNAL
jgi:hypothetical protein